MKPNYDIPIANVYSTYNEKGSLYLHFTLDDTKFFIFDSNHIWGVTELGKKGSLCLTNNITNKLVTIGHWKKENFLIEIYLPSVSVFFVDDGKLYNAMPENPLDTLVLTTARKSLPIGYDNSIWDKEFDDNDRDFWD